MTRSLIPPAAIDIIERLSASKLPAQVFHLIAVAVAVPVLGGGGGNIVVQTSAAGSRETESARQLLLLLADESRSYHSKSPLSRPPMLLLPLLLLLHVVVTFNVWDENDTTCRLLYTLAKMLKSPFDRTAFFFFVSVALRPSRCCGW